VTTALEEQTHTDLADRFRERGFAYGGQVLSPDTVESMRQEVIRVIDDRDRTDIPQPVHVCNMGQSEEQSVWQIVNIWQASEVFRELIFNSEITSMAAALIGAKELRLWHDQIQYKPAETGGVNAWHQDSPYWQSIQPKDQQLSAWIALDDADVDNGCMSMVPGSHKWGDAIEVLHRAPDFCALPARYKGNEVAVVRCPVPAGGVHFHHSLTWHGSHANTSGRPRRAIALHFMTENTVHDASGDHCMKPFITAEDGCPITDEVFPRVY